jgi:hypothetical protein
MADQQGSAHASNNDVAVGQQQAVGEAGLHSGVDAPPGFTRILGAKQVSAQTEQQQAVSRQRQGSEEGTLVRSFQEFPSAAMYRRFPAGTILFR